MLLTLALLAALHGAAPADTLGGPWRITGDVAGNPLDIVCTFKQAGTALSGTCTSAETGEHELTGELKDGKVTFRHAGEYQGQALTLIYTGTLESPTRLKGSVLVEPFSASGTFSAAPAPPKP